MTVLNGTEPECPRCGYELRGTVESWRNACPLEGRCTECGLAFPWRDILTEEALTPPWCVEFSSRRGVPRALVATLGLSFVPWRFWSSVKMTHAIRPSRLVLYVLFLAFSCCAILAVTNGIFMYKNWRDVFGTGGQVTNTMSIGEAVVRSMVLPLSTEPLGTVTWNLSGKTAAYMSPRSFLRNWRDAWNLLRFWAIAAVLGPLALIGLVASRRRAGIRPRHLVRAFVYSLGWVPFMWANGMVLLLPYHWFMFGWSARWLNNADYVMMFVIPAFVLLWWHAAVRRYLRMEHSWVVAASVSVLAMGGAMVIMLGLESDFVDHIFSRLGLV